MLLRLHGSRYVDALPDTDQQLENAIVAGLSPRTPKLMPEYARYLDEIWSDAYKLLINHY